MIFQWAGCGALGEKGPHEDGALLLLPPSQKRMSFVLRLLVHWVSESPVNLLLKDGEEQLLSL